mmetsp:Transcript_8601/g.12258  ORF Transcript_8601/g.12258 Transcript_8601/m.12258 type:complete len:297 (-) Transcript_8601:164-1054(-)
MLAQKMGCADLSSRKKFIKTSLTEILDEMADDEESTDDEESEEDTEEEVEPPPKKKRKGGSGGLSAVKEISDELSEFLGKGKQMARTEVVKALWEYIKQNDLQNPNDRREIMLDEKMRNLFHCEKFTMFTMNKYVGAHIHPFTKVNLNELSENSKKKKQEAAEKRAKNDKKKQKKPRKVGTCAPFRLSPELASVVGKDILPRPQVTQALWVYIKKQGLQNPEDKREIICDDILRPIMGGNDKVTIFSMNKHISPHMLEKVDRSEYIHEEKSGEESQDDERQDEDSATGSDEDTDSD